MSIQKILGWGLYAGLWAYALTDTLFPSYINYNYSPFYGYMPAREKTFLKDVQLYNSGACEFAISVICCVIFFLAIKQHLTRRRQRQNHEMIRKLANDTSRSR